MFSIRDSEYEDAYNKAIKEYVPDELVIIDPTKTGQSWPKDDKGYTYIPVKCTPIIDPISYYMNIANKYQQELKNLKKKLKDLLS